MTISLRYWASICDFVRLIVDAFSIIWCGIVAWQYVICISAESLRRITKKKWCDMRRKSRVALTSPSWPSANLACTNINAKQIFCTTLITSEGADTWVTTTFAVPVWMEPYCITATPRNPIRRRSETATCGEQRARPTSRLDHWSWVSCCPVCLRLVVIRSRATEDQCQRKSHSLASPVRYSRTVCGIICGIIRGVRVLSMRIPLVQPIAPILSFVGAIWHIATRWTRMVLVIHSDSPSTVTHLWSVSVWKDYTAPMFLFI